MGEALSLRLVIIGWGALARRLVELINQSQLNVELVAIGLRKGTARPADVPKHVLHIFAPEQLEHLKIDLVVEAAKGEAVHEWGGAALRYAKAFAPASTSAFVDEDVMISLLATAKENGSRLLIFPGALAGVDALRAAAHLELEFVRHTIIKPCAGWRGTAAEQILTLDQLATRTEFFRGTARQAAAAFPQNANVAVISALAGLGLDATHVVLVADPEAISNCHRLEAKGVFGALTIEIENRPLRGNPKTSEMTALALLRLIENETGQLII